MRRRIYLFILAMVALGTLISLSAGKSRYEELYENYKSCDFKQLKEKGNNFIQIHEADSALGCYMLMTSRYSEKIDIEDKRLCADAYNNAAYVHTLLCSDYSLAYQFLLKAMEIVKDTDYERLKPSIYVNLGNIYLYFDDYSNASHYYEMAYDIGVEEGEWKAVIASVNNLMLSMYSTCDSQTLLSKAEGFLQLDIPSEEKAGFSKEICEMMIRFLKGDLTGALEKEETSREMVDSKFLPERMISQLSVIKATIFRKQNRYVDALEELKENVAKSGATTTGDLVFIYRNISEIYSIIGENDSAMSYRVKSLDTRDSVLRQQNYASIRDMHSTFEVQKFEQDIREIEKRRQRNLEIALLASVVMIILLIFTFLLYRKNKRLGEALEDLYKINKVEMNQSGDNSFSECEDGNNNEELSVQEDDKERFSLDKETTEEIVNEILKVMNDITVICQCEFTIKRLAELIDTKERYVSYVINECMHKNFNALLNEYRITEAKRIFSDKGKHCLTIEAVGISLGFKSRSNFVSVFKKETGLTPSEFRSMSKNDIDSE